MKQIFISLTAILCSIIALAQTSDETAVKQVVTSAYVEGIQNNGSIEDIRKGFHPSFNMLRLMENDINPYPIEEWIAVIEKRKSEAKPEAKPIRTEAKFLQVDITGNAAVVKLALFREGKQTFTDYITLYKFAEGWRIVSKTYYRH
jgi:hypothetical protein